ncbi:hypothetical protein [Methylobacterium nigriterrae]|uniref:hypothetical protein n=1 Tax=Methylobacterium nigriterrae TaxID=3127512 RepID=UPI003013C7CE
MEFIVHESAQAAQGRHDREAELEAEIGRLRRSLDEAVRRTVDDVPAATVGYEQEVADLRAALAL